MMKSIHLRGETLWNSREPGDEVTALPKGANFLLRRFASRKLAGVLEPRTYTNRIPGSQKRKGSALLETKG